MTIDPEIAAEKDRAVRDLDRRLSAYVPDVTRWPLAVDFVDALIAEGWRPPLRPAPSWKTAAGTPAEPNADWRHARALLDGKLADRTPIGGDAA